MARYAIINVNLVENVILADAEPTVPGRTVVLLAVNQIVGPGDSYSGGVFTRYVPTVQEIFRREAPDRIRQAVATLNTWAADERATAANWASLSDPQKDAANRQLHDRIGRFFDRFGDLLITLTLD